MATLSTDPAFHMKLAEYRYKAANGTITLAEMREAVAFMRQGRVAAAAASTASAARKTKAASAAPVDSDKLLAELGGL